MSYEEQIMSKDKYPSMFSPQMEAIVFIILQIFYATRAVLKIGEYIEDITRWREDMNFMFEWQELYLTSERSERVRYCSCHENIKFISSSHRIMFFLLYGD